MRAEAWTFSARLSHPEGPAHKSQVHCRGGGSKVGSAVGWRLRRPRVETHNDNFLVTAAGGRVLRSRPTTRPNGVGRPHFHFLLTLMDRSSPRRRGGSNVEESLLHRMIAHVCPRGPMSGDAALPRVATECLNVSKRQAEVYTRTRKHQTNEAKDCRRGRFCITEACPSNIGVR